MSFKFVGLFDFINYDVGDISTLPSWDGGENSTTPSYEQTLDFVLDAVKAENPDFVLVSGDLVMGRWDVDTANRQIFGPTNNLAQKRNAVDAAADFYYPIWKNRFTSRDLVYYTAVGDHEIGDNPWPLSSDKYALMEHYKNAYYRHFGDLYHNFQYQNLNLSIVDVWEKIPQAIHAKLSATQLSWLQGQLDLANAQPDIDWKIVTGHTPVVTPFRKRNSSGITYSGGVASPFWQTLKSRKVDLYLGSEVHDITAANNGGVEHHLHGALIGYHSPINYCVYEIDGQIMNIRMMRLNVSSSGPFMWQTDMTNRPLSVINVSDPQFTLAGTLTINKTSGQTVYSNRTGVLTYMGDPVDPPVDPPIDPPIDPPTEPPGMGEVIVDQTLATLSPAWIGQNKLEAWDDSHVYSNEPNQTAVFAPELSDDGSYGIDLWWVRHDNRSERVAVLIETVDGPVEVEVNQRVGGEEWFEIGVFNLNKATAMVTITTKNSNRGRFDFAIADAVRFRGGDPVDPPIDPPIDPPASTKIALAGVDEATGDTVVLKNERATLENQGWEIE